MTPTERREALALLHWTQRGLAAVLGYSEGNVRRWFRDPNAIAPAEVDEWLARIARSMLANPPPKRTTLRQPSATNGAKLPRNSANGD